MIKVGFEDTKATPPGYVKYMDADGMVTHVRMMDVKLAVILLDDHSEGSTCEEITREEYRALIDAAKTDD